MIRNALRSATFDPRVGRCDAPVDRSAAEVTPILPHRALLAQGLPVADASVQALAAQDTQLDLYQRSTSFRTQGYREFVHDQDDYLSLGVLRVAQVPDGVHPLHHDPTIGDADGPVPPQRLTSTAAAMASSDHPW
jgi:hypothetical protein